jgi:hypothetical protein
MVPTPWQGHGAGLRQALQQGLKSTTAGADDAPAPRLRGAERAAVLRRRALLALVLLTAVLASVLLLMTQPMQGSAPGLLPMRLLRRVKSRLPVWSPMPLLAFPTTSWARAPSLLLKLH